MLRDIRKKAGLTQGQVADAIGIKQNTYSAWETGRSAIPKAKQAALADFFDVPMNEITTSPIMADSLSKDEKAIVQLMREDYSFSKSASLLLNLFWLASTLDDEGNAIASVVIRQFIEAYRDLFAEYLTHYETESHGRIAEQKLENAKELSKAATEEFNDFVENIMRQYAEPFPF